ncbi:PP2C family protein-serine/threonine phosphatase [Limnoglobus roseus]|uniref:Serine/threonine-protein phosphatase n=1 Tax=Limnoglobus roseus TaxID=2598579 RepID=A0A5C1AEQ9_9BACT|nr:protein phosphatase 2C domain-containing protein [Limnoglobus roseus]QEL17899.1 serine/threonine-protein phosphatase [Limnoglobus roseus]
MSSAKVRYAALTDVGAKRSHNQDACAVQLAADEQVYQTQGHIFIVADGMGGHAVGEKASAKAIRDIPLTYAKHVPQEGVVPAIRRSFTEANSDIFDIGVKNPEFKGLGTTGTALFLRAEGAWVGHVGDSRAYRIRSGRVEQLTFDHSWVWEIARRQGIDPDQLGDFKKNVIVRSLGPDEQVEVDIEGPHPTQPGDIFLLCSDGLSNEVTPDEIGAVAMSFPPEEAAKFLISLANIRGGRDNITCIIVQVPGSSSTFTPKVTGAVPGVLQRFLKLCDRVMPWPYLFLAAGSLFAIVSLVLQIQSVSGALPLFGLAAAIIVAGVGGMVLHLQRASQEAGDGAEAVHELHVYKTYPFEIAQSLFDRFAQKDDELKDVLKDHASIDWATHSRLNEEAQTKGQQGDWPTAFRAKCHALQMLAIVFNQDRGKGEEFRPNWDNPKHR